MKIKYIGKSVLQSCKYGSITNGREFELKQGEAMRLLKQKDKIGNKMFVELEEESKPEVDEVQPKAKKKKSKKLRMVIEEDGD